MVFDEIHYMRDPGEGGGGRRNWVMWSGEKGVSLVRFP